MAVELDDIHYQYREIDGYNKPFNFVMGAREVGKSAMFWIKKIYARWKLSHKPWIIMTRSSVEINEAFITSIFDSIINKFTDDNITPEFNKGSFKDGIVDVKIKDKLFFRIVSLSIPLRRIKLALLKNIDGVMMDEYIIDSRTGEKYIKEEAFKIKEAYTTWRREADGILKCYFLANVYSLFNPLFVSWKVEVNKLKKGTFYVGDNFVIHWCEINPLLREKLLEMNPLYKFDSDYIDYALAGNSRNDKNIKLGTLPKGFYLKYVFKIANQFLAVYRNPEINENEDRFFVRIEESVSNRRDIYCFDLEEMIDRSILLSTDEKYKLSSFREAYRKRLVAFDNINAYYLSEEIYKNL